MPFPNEHACRLRDPGDFDPDSFRRVNRKTDEGKRIALIIGKLKGESSTTTQAIRYPISDWTESQARQSCKRNRGILFEPATNKGKAQMAHTLKGVEIFAVGTWNGTKFNLEDLQEMEANFKALKAKGTLKVPVKLGHDQDAWMDDGQPALGWIDKVTVKENKLTADIVNVPDVVATAITEGLYKQVSVELVHIRFIGWILVGVALLGADLPAVNNLDDLQKYLTDTFGKYEGIEEQISANFSVDAPKIERRIKPKTNLPDDDIASEVEHIQHAIDVNINVNVSDPKPADDPEPAANKQEPTISEETLMDEKVLKEKAELEAEVAKMKADLKAEVEKNEALAKANQERQAQLEQEKAEFEFESDRKDRMMAYDRLVLEGKLTPAVRDKIGRAFDAAREDCIKNRVKFALPDDIVMEIAQGAPAAPVQPKETASDDPNKPPTSPPEKTGDVEFAELCKKISVERNVSYVEASKLMDSLHPEVAKRYAHESWSHEVPANIFPNEAV